MPHGLDPRPRARRDVRAGGYACRPPRRMVHEPVGERGGLPRFRGPVCGYSRPCEALPLPPSANVARTGESRIGALLMTGFADFLGRIDGAGARARAGRGGPAGRVRVGVRAAPRRPSAPAATGDRAGRLAVPSTTTAHLTTLYTGLPVEQHGLYEWHVYEPSLDADHPAAAVPAARDDDPPLALDPRVLVPGATSSSVDSVDRRCSRGDPGQQVRLGRARPVRA